MKKMLNGPWFQFCILFTEWPRSLLPLLATSVERRSLCHVVEVLVRLYNSSQKFQIESTIICILLLILLLKDSTTTVDRQSETLLIERLPLPTNC